MLRRDYTIRREATERWLADQFFHPCLYDEQLRDECIHPAWPGSTIQPPPTLTRLYTG
jgi:hypothetical protein